MRVAQNVIVTLIAVVSLCVIEALDMALLMNHDVWESRFHVHAKCSMKLTERNQPADRKHRHKPQT